MLRNGKTNWDMPEKSIPRGFAMAYEKVIGNKKDNVKLFFPSHSHLDIDIGLENPLIKKDDFIIAVDNYPPNYKEIEEYLQKNFSNRHYFFKGNIEDLRFDNVWKEHKELKGRKIGFTFFDLCGNFTYQVQKMLYDNRKYFSNFCRFGLTIAASTRRKEFEKIAYKAVKNTEYIDKLERFLADSKNNLARNIIGEAIKVENGRQKVKKDGAARAINVIKSIKIGCYSFMIALCNRKMYIKRLYRYKNGKYNKEMVFIDIRFEGKKIEDNTVMNTIIRYNEIKEAKAKAKAKAKHKKSKKSKLFVKLNYIDRFNIKSLKDLDRPGIKAAITKLAKKEALIMNTTVEDRILRIKNGIKSGLVKRINKLKAA